MTKLLINLLFSAAFVGPTIDGEQYLKEYYQWAFEEVKSHAGPMAKHVKLELTNKTKQYTVNIDGEEKKVTSTASATVDKVIINYIHKSKNMNKRTSFNNTLAIRFTLGHEIGHVIFRHDKNPIYLENPILSEQHANLFSIAILKSIGYDNETLIWFINIYFSGDNCSDIHGCDVDMREQMIYQVNQYKD